MPLKLCFPTLDTGRWCVWHIMKKILEKLQGYAAYKDIKRDLKEVVYESQSIDEFVLEWEKFICKFGLGDNDWLHSLYEDRHRWVPCFVKRYFWAGMSTTQRSEGMNSFFDGYINSQTTLQEFVNLYGNALQQKAKKEYEADFTSLNTIIPCESQSLIERQFQNKYMHEKFVELQAEFIGKMNCVTRDVVVDGNSCIYNIKAEFIRDGISQKRVFIVCFERDSVEVSCNCFLFEFRGILCKHCLLVLAHERVKEVPTKYVLQRWCKNVRRKHNYITTAYNRKDKEPHIERYDNLCKTFADIAEIACESPKMTKLFFHHIESFATNHAIPLPMNSAVTTNHLDSTEHALDQTVQSLHADIDIVQSQIHSLRCVKRKGRPCSTRKQMRFEKGGRTKRSSNPKLGTSIRNLVSPIPSIILPPAYVPIFW